LIKSEVDFEDVDEGFAEEAAEGAGGGLLEEFVDLGFYGIRIEVLEVGSGGCNAVELQESTCEGDVGVET
jgi:hypothetical protein